MREPVTVTAAAELPVSLEEFREHLRLTTTREDASLGAFLEAATGWAEAYTGRAFVTRTLDAYFDGFSTDLCLPRPPLQSVDSVKYLDDAGDLQTVDSALYRVDAVHVPGRVVLTVGQSWPTPSDRPANVVVRYVAGYGDAAAVPSRVKAAILLAAAHYYERREATDAAPVREIPLGAKDLLWPEVYLLVA